MHLKVHRPDAGVLGKFRNLPALHGVFTRHENIVGVPVLEGIDFKAVVVTEPQFRAGDIVGPEHRKKALGRGNAGCGQNARFRLIDFVRKVVNMGSRPGCELMRGADLGICRAGASTVSELTALGMPAIMVPSPYVTNNHQEKNARLLEAHGGAEVLLEREANGAALYRAAADILRSPDKQTRMKQGMLSLGIPDATERIYETVMALVK